MGDHNGPLDKESGPPGQGSGNTNDWVNKPEYMYAGAPDDLEQPAGEHHEDELPDDGLPEGEDAGELPGQTAHPWAPGLAPGDTRWPAPGDATRVDPPADVASGTGPSFGQGPPVPPRPVPAPGLRGPGFGGPGARRAGPPDKTTVLGAMPGGTVPPRTPPRGPRGPKKTREGRRPIRTILIGLAIFLVLLLAGLALTNNLSLLGFGGGSPSSNPSISNSASGGAGTAPATQGASSGGGIVMPSGTASATGSPSATATGSPSGAVSATSAPTQGAGAAGPTSAPSAQAGHVCVTTDGWNTDPQSSDQMVHRQTPIVSATPGVHSNCDRLVFVIKRDHPFKNGDTVGFRAGYASRILSDPKGDLMPLGGHPAIQLVILAPSNLHPDKNGYVISPSQLQSASSQEDDGSFSELQWVKLGGSFEGQTQLVISVRDEHPFAAFSQVDAHGNLLVILDVAARAHGNVPSPAPTSSN